MKFLKVFLLTITLGLYFTAQATTSSKKFYTELGSLVLSAEQPAIIEKSSADEDESEEQQIKSEPTQQTAPVDLSVKTAPRTQQLQTWFSLLSKHAHKDIEQRLVTQEIAEKLNVLVGTPSNLQHSIIGNLPLLTLVGTASTAETLMLCDNTQDNQEIIIYFTQNPDALRATQKALSNIEAGMALYLTFMEQQSDAEKATFDQLYFKGYLKPLNKSIAAFTAAHGAQAAMTTLQNMPQGSGIIAGVSCWDAYQSCPQNLSMLQTAKYYGIDTPLAIVKEIIKVQFEKHSFTPTGINRLQDLKDLGTLNPLAFATAYINMIKNGARGSLGDNAKFYEDLYINSSLAKLIAVASQLFVDVQYIYTVRTNLQNNAFENTIFINMQTRLMGVAKIVEGLIQLNEIAYASQLASLQNYVSDIEQLLAHMQGSSELGSLLNRLVTKTFKGDPSYWSNHPRILVAYGAMQEHKTAFVPALRAAGMVDALQAAAQLYLDHQEQSARYSFVTFVNDARPTVQLTNFWNPLMKADQAVCNTVHLGKGGDKNMLLTGPNGSGKSVNMKAIALNIILAQAFGIAAADQAILTPFSMIETYLNEQEDLQQGLSTFMAEAKKLDDICRKIRSLKPGEKIFVLMDEMLKGTVEEAGAQKVYEADWKLASKIMLSVSWQLTS